MKINLIQNLRLSSFQTKMRQIWLLANGIQIQWIYIYNLYYFGRDSLKDLLCVPNYFQIGTVVFDKFSLYIHKKKLSLVLFACFSMDQYDLNNLGREPFSAKLCSNWLSGF